MKIAIITLKDSPNYGGILQAYALQKAIEMLGHECYLIDYMNDAFRHKFSFFGKPKGMSTIYWIFKKIQYPLMIVMMRKMMPFYKHMRITRRFDKREELKELNSEYNVFITGSDQVWACDLNYFDDSYFLSFVDDQHKKLSYAASFGRTINMMNEEEKKFIAPQLDRFDALAVRENSGIEVIQVLSGREDAISLLDPTFLLNRNDWEKIASHDHKGKGKKYILCYLMQSKKNDTEALKYAKKVAKKTGMPIIKICRGLTSILWGKTAYVPSVEEWVGLFMDAEYIITNSFHGMAFSVNFQKNFTSFIEGDAASGRNSRIYDRCKDFGLLNRIQKVGDSKTENYEIIDYTKVEPVLQSLREKSIAYLDNILR